MTSAVSIDKLTESQRKAVFHKTGPLLVLAGPGSGKTRVITCRIAALIESGVRPYHICAITFTNKAAEEMRLRVEQSTCSAGVYVSTFHALCVRILRRYAEQAGIGQNFTIYDVDDQKRCMKEAIAACQIDTGNFTPARMLDYISNLKNDLEDETAFAARANDYFSKYAARIYAKYQALLRQNNAVDFDDLLLKTAFLLRDYPDVRMELSNRFRYLLVDEYQDTNHAQYQIAKGLALTHRNICVTGDPDQSIYRWRGADIQNILAFEKDWPEAVVVKLEENFRSTPNILEKASRLIRVNTQRKHKDLIATRPAGEPVVIQTCEDEAHETRHVAERIKALINEGVDPNEIAVFFRVNSMSRTIEESLIRDRLPYQVVRGVEFYARKEIRDMLSYLKLIVNPKDDIAFQRAVGTHPRGIGKTSVQRLEDYGRKMGLSLLEAAAQAEQVPAINHPTQKRLKAFAAMIDKFRQDINGPVGPLMDCVFAETGYADALKTADRDAQSAIDNVNELINAAAEYDSHTESPSLIDYMQTIALYSDTDAYDPQAGRISLMTLHAAKGLEFDYVFIIGLEEGILPHERSLDGGKEDIEEERRLLFVGMTRARKYLHLSYARHRVLRGQFIRSTPSPFLYEIGFEGEQNGDFSEDWGTDEHPTSLSASGPSNAAAGSWPGTFRVNELVQHSKFGLGRVKEYLDMGADSIVVVRFNSGHTKSLLVKYANLERIGR
ncbi:MAG: UvrD-helicase domain-containing protein [Planctomycetes bacterium]|nr:UvrD-helicase domain-containing protein [Planctomycetota bacterium]